MALTPGTRLGVYEVTAPIGEGGIGKVYRATDTTLSRQVAIKILPDAFACDPDRMAAQRLRAARCNRPLAHARRARAVRSLDHRCEADNSRSVLLENR